MVTIIIPFRKEEETIVNTLENIRENLRIPHQVICVDDSVDSNDRTPDIVRKYTKQNRNLIMLLEKSENARSGFSSALTRGFEAAKTDLVVVVMADLCDRIGDIAKMYDLMQKDKTIDVVTGSRYMPGGGKTGGPLIQGISSSVVNFFLNRFANIPTTDSTNAFKMYRKNILNKLRLPDGMGVEASLKLTLMAYRLGAKFTDIPTHWTGRNIGFSKFRLLKRAPKYVRLVYSAVSAKV